MALFDDLFGAGLGFLGTRLAGNQEQSAVDRAIALADPLSVAGPSGLSSFSNGLLTMGLTPQLAQAFGSAGQGAAGALGTLAGTNFASAEDQELARLQALRAPQIESARARLQSQLANRGRLGVGVGGGLTGGIFNPETAALEEAIARTQLGDIGAARQFSQGQQRFLADQAQSLVDTANRIQAPLPMQAQLGIQARLPAALAGLSAQPGFNEAADTRGFFSALGTSLAEGLSSGLSSGLGGLFGDLGGALSGAGQGIGTSFSDILNSLPASALGAGGSAIGNALPGAAANIGTIAGLPPFDLGAATPADVGGGIGTGAVPGSSATVPTPPGGGGLLAGAPAFPITDAALQAGAGLLGGLGALPALGSGFGLGATGAATAAELAAAPAFTGVGALPAAVGETVGLAAGGGATAAGEGLFGALGGAGGLAALGIAAPTVAGIISGIMSGPSPQRQIWERFFPTYQGTSAVTIPQGQPGAGQQGKPITFKGQTIYLEPTLGNSAPGEFIRIVGTNDVLRVNPETPGGLERIDFGGTQVAEVQRQQAQQAGVDPRGMTTEQVQQALEIVSQPPLQQVFGSPLASGLPPPPEFTPPPPTQAPLPMQIQVPQTIATPTFDQMRQNLINRGIDVRGMSFGQVEFLWRNPLEAQRWGIGSSTDVDNSP